MNSDKATFFDIHRHPERGMRSLTLSAFLAAAAKGQLFASDATPVSCPTLPSPDQALLLDSTHWVDLEIALVWALTGKLADKETIYPYRDTYRALLKSFKLPNSFHLSVVCAYLICAVRLKRNGWSAEDKNNVDDFRAFCEQLFAPQTTAIPVSTFMCAHREADEADANKLVKQLKKESFLRIINILKGIAHNLDDKGIDLTIYHLSESRYSLLAIFPNIIFTYLAHEGLGALLRTLGQHYREIEQLAGELTDDKLQVRMLPTEQHIKETRQVCVELAGADWRTLKPFEAARLVTNPHLHEITEEATMEEVTRYMPEYDSVKVNKIKTDYKHPGDEDLMQWYAEQEDLTAYAKGLYETLFYFHWGKKTKQSGGVAIGIDRDHSDFQIRAFHTGYNDAYEFGSQAPIVYLRRSDRELGKDDIHSLSLRQFWRYSGDHKR